MLVEVTADLDHYRLNLGHLTEEVEGHVGADADTRPWGLAIEFVGQGLARVRMQVDEHRSATARQGGGDQVAQCRSVGMKPTVEQPVISVGVGASKWPLIRRGLIDGAHSYCEHRFGVVDESLRIDQEP